MGEGQITDYLYSGLRHCCLFLGMIIQQQDIDESVERHSDLQVTKHGRLEQSLPLKPHPLDFRHVQTKPKVGIPLSEFGLVKQAKNGDDAS